MDSNVIHLKDIGKPKSSQNVPESDPSGEADLIEDVDSQEPWPERFTTELSTFLSQEKVLEVKQIYLEGLTTASTDPSEVSSNKGRRQRGSGGIQQDKKQVISDVSLLPPPIFIVFVESLPGYCLQRNTNSTASCRPAPFQGQDGKSDGRGFLRRDQVGKARWRGKRYINSKDYSA